MPSRSRKSETGCVCEQFAGRPLLHAGVFFAEPEFYCWTREKRQSSTEVDYLVSHKDHGAVTESRKPRLLYLTPGS